MGSWACAGRQRPWLASRLRTCGVRAVLGLIAGPMVLFNLTGCGDDWVEFRPDIVRALPNETVLPGETARFAVVATGKGPLTYRWFRNGQVLPDASASAEALTVGPQDNGAVVTVEVSDARGSAVSSGVLTVPAAPTFTTQPVDQSVVAGERATFNAAARGTGTLAFQWYQNDVAIPGANLSVYALPAATLANSGDHFSVIVSNGMGMVLSATARLSVRPKTPELAFALLGTHSFGGPTFAVRATSDSFAVVRYSVVSGPATISGAKLRLTGTGTVVIRAQQAATGDFGPAVVTASLIAAPRLLARTRAAVPIQVAGHDLGQRVGHDDLTRTSVCASCRARIANKASVMRQVSFR